LSTPTLFPFVLFFSLNFSLDVIVIVNLVIISLSQTVENLPNDRHCTVPPLSY
jgi:hypothetical protein